MSWFAICRTEMVVEMTVAAAAAVGWRMSRIVDAAVMRAALLARKKSVASNNIRLTHPQSQQQRISHSNIQ